MELRKEYWTIYRAAYTRNPISDPVKEEIKRIYKTDGRDKIEEAAKKKKLIPALARLFVSLDLDKDYWESIENKYRERNKEVICALDKMYSLLRDNGITRIAVVENFGALLSSSADLSLFGSGDVDEYAYHGDRERIYEILQNNGYSVTEVKAGDNLISTTITNAVAMPEGFHFSINWDLTCRINLPCFSSNGDFVDWDKCRYYKDTSIRIPSQESLMYICLMHIAVHGFCKAPDIRLYFDITNAAENGIDWSIIENYSRRDNNCVKVAMAAYLSKMLLGVDVPDSIINMGTEKQFELLKKTVYDEKLNILNDFPNAKERILIEIYSDDFGKWHGLSSIIFPNKKWVKNKYGAVGVGRIKHIVGLLKR